MKARRDIDIADPLAVGQRVTLEIMNGGFGEPWLHATGTLLRMEDTETGVIVHVDRDDGSRLSAHVWRKGILNGRLQEGVQMYATEYRIRIETNVAHRQFTIPMLAHIE